jgi:hypothetical protein
VVGSISISSSPSNAVTQTWPPASARKHGLPSTEISARIPSSSWGVGDAALAGGGGDGNSPITSPEQAARMPVRNGRARNRTLPLLAGGSPLTSLVRGDAGRGLCAVRSMLEA